MNERLLSKPTSDRLVKAKTAKCPVCGQTKELKEFYTNKDWIENDYHDKWCISCYKAIDNRARMREYFWENNREWSDSVWDKAIDTAEKKLEDNAVFRKSSEDRRASMIAREAVMKLAQTMNGMNYAFLHKKDGDKDLTYREAILQGILPPDDIDENPHEKEYSDFFNGYFTKRELQFMQNYYNGLMEDYELDNENLRDYARKCARASMIADRAQDDYAAGRIPFSDVKDALTQFDLLSKSANFAACKHKDKDNNGLTSFSELTQYLCTNGHPCTRKIEWEPDDVDRTLAEYRHIVNALGLEQV